MDLSTNQIIASVLSTLILLKMLILFLLPTQSFKKFISIYDKINLNIFYYLYIGIGSFLFYYIYKSSNFTFSDMLVIGFSMNMVIGAGMIKMIGNDGLSMAMKKYNTFGKMFKSLWLYIILWMILAILALKEIFIN